MNTQHNNPSSLLEQELLRLHRTSKPSGKHVGIAIARLLSGMDMEDWQQIAPTLPAWCAVEIDKEACALSWQKVADPPLPLISALALAPFMRQVEKELLRARRGLFPVTLLVCGIQNKKQRSRRLLSLIRKYMASCDSIGLLQKAQYALLLPASSIAKARSIAEAIRTDCLMYTKLHSCVAGIASSCSGDMCANDLLCNALHAFESAHASKLPICSQSPKQKAAHNDALVDIQEKRFLFSGGSTT